jgi:cytidine deaminase
MTGGNRLREAINEGAALAKLAVRDVRLLRRRRSGDDSTPADRTAYILRSLKHPDEAEWLRRMYGARFFLVGCHTPRGMRISTLASRIAASRFGGDAQQYRQHAEALATRDEREHDNVFGQNVSDTFSLADFFVDLTDKDQAKNALDRFVRLILSEPFHSPTIDEYAMFHAFAAAARSSDLSRQVGAAIATDRADIVAVGCNEVPRAGGGAYWEGDAGDARDFRRGGDANHQQRDLALSEVLERLRSNGWLCADRVDATPLDFRKLLAGARADNLTEFGRAVHAEMSAITDAARRGVSVRRGTLYSTTFPCHNCAKHIVAAGIARVVFIAPYPKSLAGELHDDALVIDDPGREDLVQFVHFSGIAPGLYLPLFQKRAKRKHEDGTPIEFRAADARPALASAADPNYLEREALGIDDLPEPGELQLEPEGPPPHVA